MNRGINNKYSTHKKRSSSSLQLKNSTIKAMVNNNRQTTNGNITTVINIY